MMGGKKRLKSGAEILQKIQILSMVKPSTICVFDERMGRR
jgi:hypothetical protein